MRRAAVRGDVLRGAVLWPDAAGVEPQRAAGVLCKRGRAVVPRDARARRRAGPGRPLPAAAARGVPHADPGAAAQRVAWRRVLPACERAALGRALRGAAGTAAGLVAARDARRGKTRAAARGVRVFRLPRAVAGAGQRDGRAEPCAARRGDHHPARASRAGRAAPARLCHDEQHRFRLPAAPTFLGERERERRHAAGTAAGAAAGAAAAPRGARDALLQEGQAQRRHYEHHGQREHGRGLSLRTARGAQETEILEYAGVLTAAHRPGVWRQSLPRPDIPDRGPRMLCGVQQGLLHYARAALGQSVAVVFAYL